MNVAAVQLAGMAVLTLVVVGIVAVAWPSRTSVSWWLRGVWGGGGLVFLTLFGMVSHMCGAGQATRQWLLVVLLWLLAAGTLSRVPGLAIALAVCLVGVLTLTFHYNSVVHRPDYTGNPRWAIRTARPGEAVTVDPLWHTPLTGIYAVRRSGP